MLDQLVVTAAHFKAALKLCSPSALRETKVEIPNSKWEDIGGLEEVCFLTLTTPLAKVIHN